MQVTEFYKPMPLIKVLQNSENARPGGEFKGLIQFLLWLLRSFNIFHFILILLMYFYCHSPFFIGFIYHRFVL